MMYALRMTKYKMFLRHDGGGTDNKASAILFNTIEQARDYVSTWRGDSYVVGSSSMQISIVEVETKPVIKKIGKDVEIV